jgi:hypothetical protein
MIWQGMIVLYTILQDTQALSMKCLYIHMRKRKGGSKDETRSSGPKQNPGFVIPD